MLKKTAHAVITSGLFLAPLGASAMVGDSPFPACIGPDCTIVSHDDRRNPVAVLSESARKTSGRSNTLAEQKRSSTSPFPEDNSND